MRVLLVTVVGSISLLANAVLATDLKRRDPPPGYQSVGCVPGDGLTLTGNTQLAAYSNTGMTLEFCALVCSSSNYFAVRYGGQCRCGDAVEIPDSSFGDALDCSTPCTGNIRAGKAPSDAYCGGNAFSSVYQKLAGTIPNFPTTSTYHSIGCYSDPVSNLLSQSDTGAGFRDGLTIERCEGLCRGYRYFGLKYGVGCYCGDTIPINSRMAPTSTCNAPCSGNTAQLCGGTFPDTTISVYATPDFAACGQLNTDLHIQNPGFEGGVIGWTATIPDNKAQWVAVAGAAHSGRRFARITNRGGTGLDLSQRVDTCPGRPYVLTFWARGSGCDVIAMWENANVISTSRDGDWTAYRAYINPSGVLGELRFNFDCNGGSTIVKSCLDDVELRPATSDDAILIQGGGGGPD